MFKGVWGWLHIICKKISGEFARKECEKLWQEK